MVVLSAAGTLSAAIAAIALVFAVRTYYGTVRGRDFTAVTAMQKMIRDESNAWRSAAFATPRNAADYEWHACSYLDALNVMAFAINEQILDRKSLTFQSVWLRAELETIYEHKGDMRKIFFDAVAKGAYDDIVSFYGARPSLNCKIVPDDVAALENATPGSTDKLVDVEW